jgi:exonuclease III
MVHVTIQLQIHRRLHVVAVYTPVTTSTIPDREQVYEHLSSVISDLPSTDGLLLTGDWNAALCKQDRLHSSTTL